MSAPSPHRWRGYYSGTAGRPPRHTLLEALARFAAEGKTPGLAVDLGCGTGRDTLELLARGWRVMAIDGEGAALDRLRGREDLPDGARLDTRLARFEDLEALPSADLVNASFCLPFCAAFAFPRLWDLIRAALPPGGRFAGQLLGPRDTWAVEDNATAFTSAEVDDLLAGYAVELHEVEEQDSLTARRKPKHWHIHHLVLRRISD